MPSKKRGRLTRELLPVVAERVAGCDLCAAHREQEDVAQVCKVLRFRKNEIQRVVKHMTCPECEASPRDFSTLALWEPNEWDDLLRQRRWKTRYEDRLSSFAAHLARFPSLGLAHPAGGVLRTAVRRARVIAVDQNPWFRARTISPEPPPTEGFLPADPHVVGIPPGRFNHAGQVALYVADSADTAAAEKLVEEEGELWIAELTFERALRVLDLRVHILGERTPQSLLLAGLHVSLPRQPTDRAPREWLITQFIADLVRMRPTVDGVLYTSSRDAPGGQNIVIVSGAPVHVSRGARRYRWAWKHLGSPFEAIRSHMKAQPLANE